MYVMVWIVNLTSSLQNNWMVDHAFLEHPKPLDGVLEKQLLQPGQLADRYEYVLSNVSLEVLVSIHSTDIEAVHIPILLYIG